MSINRSNLALLSTGLALTLAACGGNDRELSGGMPQVRNAQASGSTSGTQSANRAPGTTGAAGESISCSEWLDCANVCGQDESCVDACTDRLSSTGFDALTALLECAQRVNCTGSVCLETLCGSQVDACFAAPPPTAATGALTCGEWVECVRQCSDGDQACGDQCTNSLSATGTEHVQDLFSCMDVHGCNDSACVEESCARELERCFN